MDLENISKTLEKLEWEERGKWCKYKTCTGNSLKYFLNDDVLRSYKQDINLRNMEKRIHTEKQSVF